MVEFLGVVVGNFMVWLMVVGLFFMVVRGRGFISGGWWVVVGIFLVVGMFLVVVDGDGFILGDGGWWHGL